MTFFRSSGVEYVPARKRRCCALCGSIRSLWLAEEHRLCNIGVDDAFVCTTIDAGTPVLTPFQRAIHRLSAIARGAPQSSRYGHRRNDGPLCRRTVQRSETVTFEEAQEYRSTSSTGFTHTPPGARPRWRTPISCWRTPGSTDQSARFSITCTYATRHGDGSFAPEDALLMDTLADPCNRHCPWQGSFHVSRIDLVMLRYAYEVVSSLDTLAVTCMDCLAEMPSLQVCCR